MAKWLDVLDESSTILRNQIEKNSVAFPQLWAASQQMTEHNISIINMQDRGYQEDFWDVRANFMPPVDVLNINEDVAPPDDGYIAPIEVAKAMVRKASFRYILDRCVCREACDCQNYPHELGCIFLGKAATEFDMKAGHLATPEEACAHLDKLQAAGLCVHIGHVPFDAPAFGISPENRNKFMSICGCCHCCSVTRFIPTYKNMPGLRLHCDYDKCIGCGTCEATCGYKGIFVQDGKANLRIDNCKACGNCVYKCPVKALEIKVMDPEYVKRSIEWISTYTDIVTAD